MPKIVITDSSTMILFKKIDELNLLKKVYGKLIITPEVETYLNEPQNAHSLANYPQFLSKSLYEAH